MQEKCLRIQRAGLKIFIKLAWGNFAFIPILFAELRKKDKKFLNTRMQIGWTKAHNTDLYAWTNADDEREKEKKNIM